MGTLSEEKVALLLRRAQREIDAGLLPSCQLALGLDGEVVFEEAVGEATLDDRYVIFSATKAVVASAVWLLIQDQMLDVSLPVIEYIPEFMAEGGDDRREQITVEQVMLHTSGFPHAPMGPPDWSRREGRLARMAAWRCNWDPGTRFEYHPTSAHWVLAELIDRITGRDFRDIVRDRVLAPHRIERLQLGVPLGEQKDILELHIVGNPATPEELEAVLGIRELPVTEVTDEALIGFNDPDTMAVGIPGGGAVSTASDLARFYQALLHNPVGLWDPDLLHDVTRTVRNTFPDPLFGRPIRRTLGLCTAGDDGASHLRGFGRTVSGDAFGHNGAGGQLAWADPATGLSFTYMTNGLDSHALRQGRRGVALSSLAAECATRG